MPQNDCTHVHLTSNGESLNTQPDSLGTYWLQVHLSRDGLRVYRNLNERGEFMFWINNIWQVQLISYEVGYIKAYII